MAASSTTKPAQSVIPPDRLAAHLVLAVGTLVGCGIACIYDPSAILAEPLALGLGYVALVYLVVSLLIGPLYLARRRRNPVNLYLRRDIGIWAGITSLLHVFFALQLYAQGQILLYFFRQVADRYLLQLNLFGLSNDVGLLATVIMVVLLVLSNDRALRWLKGPRWKRIQQWAYPLLVLTILHTWGYQLYNTRDGWLLGTLGGLTLLVGVVQLGGVLVHRQRRRQRAVRQAHRPPALPSPAPYLTPADAPGGLSRRSFLQLGGATLLAGVAGLVSFNATRALLSPPAGAPPAPGPAAPATAADAPPTAPLPPADSATAPPPAATPADSATAPPAATPADSATAPPPATAPDANPTVADPTATDPAAPAGAAPPSGVVLATLASCPVNSALTFTAPDTGETGILVHEADGSVKAFSNICTHRPYPVEYDGNSQLLICPLHYACFNAQTGDVTRGPADSPLPPMPVHVDPQGNIIYG